MNQTGKFREILKIGYVQTVAMVIIAIVIIIVFWVGLRYFSKTEHPLLAVASGSMEPILYKGDLILVAGVKNACLINAAPEYGDIIVFRKPTYSDDLIVHRAIKKDEVGGSCVFTTQGDANPAPDGWRIRESEIIGKYTGAKVPLLGYIVLFFEPIQVKIAFILLWVILLIILELIPSQNKRLEAR